ncbi:MAG: hypothetical protein AAFO69_10795, partial [Bacteroidota bacterium]
SSIDPYTEVCNHRVNIVLQELTDVCRQLLIDYYYHKRSFKDLLAKTDLGSIQALKNKKSRCMKKLGEVISARKLKMEDFYNE